jgi:glutamate carboxypeptidase
MDAPAADRPAALDLPFDAEEMLAGLRGWVECESPTFDVAAVNRMTALVAREAAMLGARIERIAARGGLADVLRVSFPHPRAGLEPGVLILAHCDTVHPIGTLAALPFRREGDRCFGPGICDMKGGTFLALEALRQMARAGIATRRPVTLLLTGDEEIGSPGTRDLIEAEARRHALVLVPEPARPDGGVVTGRYAIARFRLRATGRPSHAGSTLADGRSAIREMCRQVLAIEAMTTESATFSVGVIGGGTWVNCVPTRCEAEALSMAKTQGDLDEAAERLLARSGVAGDVAFAVERGVTRPVWEADAQVLALHRAAESLARQLGLSLPHGSSGGGSDGNFTGALGIPTLDGLGMRGAGYHTLEEHLLVSSLAPRARLFAGLLATL